MYSIVQYSYQFIFLLLFVLMYGSNHELYVEEFVGCHRMKDVADLVAGGGEEEEV